MKLVPKLTLLSTVVVLLSAAAVLLGDGVPAAVHYIGHDEVSAGLAKGTAAVVSDPGLMVQVVRREAGEAEYHDHINHIFFIVDGEATLVTGGTMVGTRPIKTALDTGMRAASIEGGQTYHLSKGDIITIPAKTPHWFKEVPTKTIAYYGVNIDSQ